MPESAITEEHEVVDHNDLDPEMVRRILDKLVDGHTDDDQIFEDVGDVLDIDPRDEARELVRDYREPDWPIEYSRTFRVNDVDVYNDFEISHDGYEPYFAPELGTITVTWRINKRENTYDGTKHFVELIEVNGHSLEDDE